MAPQGRDLLFAFPLGYACHRQSAGCQEAIQLMRLGGSVGGGLTLDFGSGHDLAVREFEPRVRLCADGSKPGACFRFCVFLSL